MASLSVSGVFLGLQTKGYDFNDRETGERRVGESHTAHLWNREAVEPIAVKVPADRLGLIKDRVAEGEPITLSVQVRTNNNRVSFALDSVLSA